MTSGSSGDHSVLSGDLRGSDVFLGGCTKRRATSSIRTLSRTRATSTPEVDPDLRTKAASKEESAPFVFGECQQ